MKKAKTSSKVKQPTKKDLEKPVKVGVSFERLLQIMKNPIPATQKK